MIAWEKYKKTFEVKNVYKTKSKSFTFPLSGLLFVVLISRSVHQPANSLIFL